MLPSRSDADNYLVIKKIRLMLANSRILKQLVSKWLSMQKKSTNYEHKRSMLKEAKRVVLSSAKLQLTAPWGRDMMAAGGRTVAAFHLSCLSRVPLERRDR